MGDRGVARVCALAMTATAASALALDLPGERTKWVTLKSAHLQLISDGAPSKAHEVALDLERMISALGQNVGVEIRLEPPTKVLLFSSPDTFQSYCAVLMGRSCADVGGLFEATRHAAYLLMPVRRFEDARRVAYHELTHALMQNSLRSVPLWLDEGIAEFYGSFYASGGEILIGRPDAEHLSTLHSTGLLPTATLLALNHDSPEFTSPSTRSTVYAQSWLMVHYILVGLPGGRARLTDFLVRRGRGEPDEQAFRAAFAVTPEEFTKDLNGYRQRSVMAALRLPATSVSVIDPGAPAPLPRHAALAELGRMLAACERCDPLVARPFVEEAHRLDPGSAHHTAVLAWVAARQGRAEEASRLFAQAAQQPADETAALLYGEYLLNLATEQARGGGAPSEPLVLRAREQFDRCLGLQPDSVAALVGLGETYLLAARADLAPGIKAYERALALAPSRPDAASGLAQLCVRAGDAARANQVIATYLADSRDPTVHTRLPELLARLEAENARTAVSRGDLAEAAAALERALARSKDEGFRLQLRSQLSLVRENAALKAAAAELNAAAAEFNAGRLADASDALQRLIPTINDATLRAQAEALRDRIAALKSAGPADVSKGAGGAAPADPGSRRALALRREDDARREADRYNEAASLATRGYLVAALKIAEDLAANAHNAEVRKAAAGLRDRLRARLAGRAAFDGVESEELRMQS